MTTTPENTWNKFFLDAHLPSEISATYAMKFSENRIQMNMLLDLNKDYLKEMDITCTGDVIAILRHAKRVHEEASRDRVLGMTSAKIPIATVAARTGQQNTQLNPRTLVSKSRQSVVIKQPTVVDSNNTIRERLGEIRSKATKRKILPPSSINSNTDLHSLQAAALNKEEKESRRVSVFCRVGRDDETEYEIPENYSSNDTIVSKLKRIDLSQPDVHSFHTASTNKEKEKKPVSIFCRMNKDEDMHYSVPEDFSSGNTFNTQLKIRNLTHSDNHNLQTATLNKEKEKKRVSVFSRVGKDQEMTYSASESMSTNQKQSALQKNVFARLGGKEPDIQLRKTIINSNELLERKDQLKEVSFPKKIIIETNGKIRCLKSNLSGGSMQADKVPLNIKQRMPKSNTQRKTVKFSPHVDFKVIEKLPVNLLTPKPPNRSATMNQIKTIPTRDVKKSSMTTVKSNNIKLRLGNIARRNNLNKIRVFDRLGGTSKHTVL